MVTAGDVLSEEVTGDHLAVVGSVTEAALAEGSASGHEPDVVPGEGARRRSSGRSFGARSTPASWRRAIFGTGSRTITHP